MLTRTQRNQLFKALQLQDIATHAFYETREDVTYVLNIDLGDDEYYFQVEANSQFPFEVISRPGVGTRYYSSWGDVTEYFSAWTKALKAEMDAPDLWAEAAKTAQLFAPTAEPSDDKFTRAELAEVQGQLRLLQQSFTTAALPELARQKLIELTETAAEKAETLTKKDWQNWIIGGFISAITALMLNPTQAGEVLKLVKAAFGGLFLH